MSSVPASVDNVKTVAAADIHKQWPPESTESTLVNNWQSLPTERVAYNSRFHKLYLNQGFFSVWISLWRICADLIVLE